MRLPLLCLVLTLASRCFASLDITTTSLPNGSVNKSYSATVYATGGCTPYKWGVVSGTLPAGITSKPSSSTTSLLLSGVPTSATTYTPTLQVSGCGGGTYKASYKIVIQAPSSVDITTASLPNGIVGHAYSAAVNAVGGCAPYKWSLISGTLPAGVTTKVSSTTTSLVLSGTPSSASTYAPTVQVTGCGGATYKHSYSIAIQGTTSTAATAVNAASPSRAARLPRSRHSQASASGASRNA